MDNESRLSFYRKAASRMGVRQRVDRYLNQFEGPTSDGVDARKSEYEVMVNDYYDLVTDFYEYGWGDSFHFAPRFASEAFKASLARHQHYLALRLGLGQGLRALDVGCGVGGPLRHMSRFSGADITGINNNAYQVEKGNRYIEEQGLTESGRLVKGDFMALPFEDAQFDRAFAIEATCHAPDKSGCFAEVFRVLKPGGLFAGYEWCTTPSYNPADSNQRAIVEDIEVGNGLPQLSNITEVDQALTTAGFEMLDSFDRAQTGDAETPWYLPLKGTGLSMASIRRHPVGRWMNRRVISMLERLKVAPKGALQVSKVLNRAAMALVASGELGIFTPCYFFLARRPW